MAILKKQETDTDVLTAALDRMRTLYDRFDKVVVSFSGGKDSTACLNLALQVARERDQLPLDVYFWDEEAIHPETVDYVARVAAMPEVRFKWLCVPIQHRNACSRRHPYWYPWAPEDRERWVREMPPEAITDLPGFKRGMSVPDIAHTVYGPEHGTVADVRGIRASESLRRYRSVATRERDNWINKPRAGYSYPVSPIYDWLTVDVWTAPHRFGWDYNRAYDVMAAAGIAANDQRVCPPYGEEPLRGLWMYAECWPDLWHRMIARVPGAATAARYSRTELYGFGDSVCPPGLTWRQYTYQLLDLYPDDQRAAIARSIRGLMREHKSKTRRPIPEKEPDRLTGISWRFLANIVMRGDLKGRRAGTMGKMASNAREAAGEVGMDGLMDADAGTRY